MTCPNCAGTGAALNPRVYVEWGNPNSGTLPLTKTCKCQGADELTTPNALTNPTIAIEPIGVTTS